MRNETLEKRRMEVLAEIQKAASLERRKAGESISEVEAVRRALAVNQTLYERYRALATMGRDGSPLADR